MTWRPVGLTRDVPAGRVMRAWVDGQDAVVWRSTRGVLSAWDNRCPHRGMALSHGFVRGEDLACLYHGWHYGAEGGVCSLIPSHPDLTPPDTIKTRAFQSAESDGVIWVRLEGSPDLAPPDLAPPDLAPPAIAPGLDPLRSFEIRASEGDIAHGAAAKPFEPAILSLLFNPIAHDRTLVTVLIEAQATSDQRKLASRWCEDVRREVEA